VAVGRFDRVQWWLDAAEPLITDDTPPLDGWHSLRAAAATARATSEFSWRADEATALAHARRAVALETDPDKLGYAAARLTVGMVLLGHRRIEEAVATLGEAWRLPVTAELPAPLRLPAAGLLASALLHAGRPDEAARVCRAVAPAAAAVDDTLGAAAGPALTPLRTAEGRLAHRTGDIPRARATLARSVALARVWGLASPLVTALVSLAAAELAGGDRAAARAALDEARDVVDSEPVLPAVRRDLAAAEARVSRSAAQSARRGPYALVEELTDRELSILRALQGRLSQREIGAELYISLNTVKGYTKSLYRKLGTASRQEAVERGRALGLI
jgi:LuxR family maltose regulon positive regulatory protein